ncbi:Helix-turn-helix domain-containing protein [Actinopolymorpha singaporensis]|uniref:Helix-turn-helix domain-containing protein n=2 Tax=Actinopolymorpha singaporensis TaxID=117157 RepID=A0A1H1P857_9ACTN|nr:Helix-turn-helix domain-containing protein [Actinopolymorpha singaporensis]
MPRSLGKFRLAGMSKPSSAAQSRELDLRSLRALAHPLRVEILQTLSTDGPSTSARLAARIGVRSGSTSWHLAKLAEAGLVVEDPERGTLRERWWQAASPGWWMDAATYLGDEQTNVEATLVLGSVIRQHLRRAEQFLGEEWPEEWRRAWILETSLPLRLTPRGLTELGERLRGVLGEFTARPDDEGAETVLVQIHGFPVHGESGR